MTCAHADNQSDMSVAVRPIVTPASKLHMPISFTKTPTKTRFNTDIVMSQNKGPEYTTLTDKLHRVTPSSQKAVKGSIPSYSVGKHAESLQNLALKRSNDVQMIVSDPLKTNVDALKVSPHHKDFQAYF